MIFILLMLAAPQAPNCTDPQTQIEMTLCAREDHERADAELNAQWKRTLARMQERDRSDGTDSGPGYVEVLRTAQRAWIAFRDAHCVSEGYQMRGGTAEPMLVNACLATLTRDRTKQLRALAEDN